MTNFRLVTADTSQLKSQIRRFWYEVYVLELGKQPDSADHAICEIADELDGTAATCCLMDGDTIAGTIRHNVVDDLNPNSNEHELFRLEELTQHIPAQKMIYASKLVISPNYRSGVSVIKLVRYAYEQLRQQAVEVVVIVAAPRLLAFYKNLGFRSTGSARHLPGVGLVVPLALAVEDLAHLRKVGSPFTSSAESFPKSLRGCEALCHVFPGFDRSCRDMSAETADVWEDLAERAFGRTPTFDPVRLSERERALLLKVGNTIHVRSSECVLDEREPGTSIFVILSGSIAVVLRTSAGDRTIMALGPGQIFGERSIARTSRNFERFEALTESEVLVLNSSEISDVILKSDFGRLVVILLRGALDRFELVLRDLVHA